jgi:hypothetical protein
MLEASFQKSEYISLNVFSLSKHTGAVTIDGRPMYRRVAPSRKWHKKFFHAV